VVAFSLGGWRDRPVSTMHKCAAGEHCYRVGDSRTSFGAWQDWAHFLAGEHWQQQAFHAHLWHHYKTWPV